MSIEISKFSCRNDASDAVPVCKTGKSMIKRSVAMLGVGVVLTGVVTITAFGKTQVGSAVPVASASIAEASIVSNDIATIPALASNMEIDTMSATATNDFFFGTDNVPEMIDYKAELSKEKAMTVNTPDYVFSEGGRGQIYTDEPAEPLNFAVSNDPDMATRSNVTAAQLESGLIKTLADHAQAFVDAENKYGVNAIGLAAISAYESGWGEHQISPNNIFGWRAGDGSYVEFLSIEECVDTVARYLSQNYLTEGAKYYSGTHVSDINKRYNGNQCWEENVSSIYSQIGANIG